MKYTVIWSNGVLSLKTFYNDQIKRLLLAQIFNPYEVSLS